ncbi:C-X-C motif chemokine 9 [Petaurus breviceps papuanus]|uniref:C-X-C motif chemokine 9 n=1 Tax=Petaurus breviceps papuanus TaxID=3040969 RepID=UPI0036DA5C76
MKSCHIAFLWGITFLTLTWVQAFPGSKTGRCSCINVSEAKIQRKTIEKLEKFPPDSSCSRTEIIATMKDGKKKCLDPDSPYVNILVKKWKMDDKNKKSKTGNKRRQTKNAKKMKKAQRPPPKKTA